MYLGDCYHGYHLSKSEAFALIFTAHRIRQALCVQPRVGSLISRTGREKSDLDWGFTQAAHLALLYGIDRVGVYHR